MSKIKNILIKILFVLVILNVVIVINLEWFGLGINIEILYSIMCLFLNLGKSILFISVITLLLALFFLKKQKNFFFILLFLSSSFNILYHYKSYISYKIEKFQNPHKIVKIGNIEKEYDEKNNLIRESEYLNGKKNGLEKIYTNNRLHFEKTYLDGKRDGFHKIYWKNGQINILTQWKNNQIIGIVKEYYTDGKLYATKPYKNGLINGVVKYFYKNGSLQSERYFKDSQKEGIVKIYNENEQIIKISKYQKNERIGDWKEFEYDKNGKMIKECLYKKPHHPECKNM